MASTRVLASRLATTMASTTSKVARPALRVQLANSSKRTITGKLQPELHSSPIGPPASKWTLVDLKSYQLSRVEMVEMDWRQLES